MSIYKVVPAFPQIDPEAKDPGLIIGDPVLDRVRALNEKMKLKGFDDSLQSCFIIAIARGCKSLSDDLDSSK